MRHAILMLTALTFAMPTGLQAVPQQADADAILVGYVNPVGVTSSALDVTPVDTTGTLDNGVVVDPFRAGLITICRTFVKPDSLDTSGLAGPIVRCEMSVSTREQWAFNAAGLIGRLEVTSRAGRTTVRDNEAVPDTVVPKPLR